MSGKKVSVRGVARTQRASEKKALAAKMRDAAAGETVRIDDSFQNFALNLGIGTDNPLSTSTYGFNPITRIRTELEWIHRGSWLGGVAVDLVADDMTREGIDLRSEIAPEDDELLDEAAAHFDIWGKLNSAIKWGRLYGGCIVVPLIDGHDPATPLKLDRIGKDAFKGLLVLDRWSVDPSLEDLVSVPGPYLGLPKYYTVTNDAPGYRGQRIHYSRAFRFTGIEVPYWQAVMENLWGISVIERLYDRMIAFDSATTGAAQLVYKSYLRTLKMPKLREAVAAGGDMLKGVVASVQFMRRYQSIEGVTLIDGQDDMIEGGATSFSGISDALLQFAQQLAGALQIPLVRLMGQSPAGLNSTGDADLRTYYDGIRKQQNQALRIPVRVIYQLMAKSLGVDLGDGFNFAFRSLWQLTEKEKSEIAKTATETVLGAYNDGVTDRYTTLKELREQARGTGIFQNITDEMIEEAKGEPPLAPPTSIIPGEEEVPGAGGSEAEGVVKQDKGGKDAPTKTADAAYEPGKIRLRNFQGLPVTIETAQGEVRRGGKGSKAWQVVMPVDYGFIDNTASAEGVFEQMDCFIGPNPLADRAWVIDQINLRNGAFDEHKVMLGFASEADAVETYVRAYHDQDRRRISGVTAMTMDKLTEWLQKGDVTRPAKMMAMP